MTQLDKRELIEYYLVLESGQFKHLTDSRRLAHFVRIIVPHWGLIYSKVVGYCLLR